MSFLEDRSGSVVTLFALAILVLVGVAGIAVDYSRALSAQAALQQSLDTTMLRVAQERLRQGQTYNVQEAAQAYMDGMGRVSHAHGAPIITVKETGGSTIQGRAEVSVKPVLMGILGFRDLNVKASSTASGSHTPVDIALVLDNTGSMRGQKLADLKSAAKSLVETVYADPAAVDDVRMSVVPFAEYVNVGMANRYAAWMSVPPDSTTTRTVCNSGSGSAQTASSIDGSSAMASSTEPAPSCTPGETYYVDDVETVCPSGTQSSTAPRSAPSGSGGSASALGALDFTASCRTITETKVWRGCAGSRPDPLNTKDEQYSVRVPGILNVNCPTVLKPLTNSQTDLAAAIDAMSASGNTFTPSGLMWGWASLSQEEPYAEAADGSRSPPPRKVIVFMTDGQNTISPTQPYDGSHMGTNTLQANQITTQLCGNVKAAKVEVYTLAFQVNDPGIKSVLENCASSPSHYFDAANSAALQAAFNNIGGNLASLRLVD